MRASIVSIFLMDSRQSFRERESTTAGDLRLWASELGAEVAPAISLAGSQFRCAGSAEYVTWLEAMLRGDDAGACARFASEWRTQDADTGPATMAAQPAAEAYANVRLIRKKVRPQFRFHLVDGPFDLVSALRDASRHGETSRLVASYSRPWVTNPKRVADPHRLPPEMQDFVFTVGSRIWARPWNVVRNEDYAAFVQAPPGTPMHGDPLSEVGCTYAVRGFDFDYVGLLWLDDLQWRDGKWSVNPSAVHESGVLRTRQRVANERSPDGPQHADLLSRVQQAYRILLTRAMKGVFVWCADGATRGRLEQCLRSPSRS
jgi:DUF2075 family protein